MVGAERSERERGVLEHLADVDVLRQDQFVEPLLEGSTLCQQRVELDLQGRPIGLRQVLLEQLALDVLELLIDLVEQLLDRLGCGHEIGQHLVPPELQIGLCEGLRRSLSVLGALGHGLEEE